MFTGKRIAVWFIFWF